MTLLFVINAADLSLQMENGEEIETEEFYVKYKNL